MAAAAAASLNPALQDRCVVVTHETFTDFFHTLFFRKVQELNHAESHFQGWNTAALLITMISAGACWMCSRATTPGLNTAAVY